VGRVLSVNTVGAILGAVVSGFALVYLFGIERSLQMLVVVNVAAGLTVAAATVLRCEPSPGSPRSRCWSSSPAGPSRPGAGLGPEVLRDLHEQRPSVESPEQIRERLRGVDVLYYHEGVNETVSVIRPKGSIQTFIVNGRPEASTALMDVQLQRTLGHLPMLLHRTRGGCSCSGPGRG